MALIFRADGSVRRLMPILRVRPWAMVVEGDGQEKTYCISDGVVAGGNGNYYIEPATDDHRRRLAERLASEQKRREAKAREIEQRRVAWLVERVHELQQAIEDTTAVDVLARIIDEAQTAPWTSTSDTAEER